MRQALQCSGWGKPDPWLECLSYLNRCGPDPSNCITARGHCPATPEARHTTDRSARPPTSIEKSLAKWGHPHTTSAPCCRYPNRRIQLSLTALAGWKHKLTFRPSKKGTEMRVLVFGTSNSLLRGGWVEGLSEALGEGVVDNLSVGMCPSTRFAAHADIDIGRYDAVFFDSVPNDEVLLNSGFDDVELDDLLGQIFCEISRCAPLFVMGFCVSDYLYSPSQAFQRHQRLCSAAGGQFIDVRDLVLELSERYGRPAEALYDDHPAHPHRALAREIGYIIGASLSQILPPVSRPNHTSDTVVQSAFARATLDSQIFAGYEKVSASTSLLTKEFIRLRGGESVSFPSSRLVGLYLNLGTANAVLRLHGSDNVRDIKLYGGKASRSRFSLNFLPLPSEFLVSRLSVEAEPGPDVFMSRYSEDACGPGEILIDLADLCFYDPSFRIPLSSKAVLQTCAIHEQVSTRLFSRPMVARLNAAIAKIDERPPSRSALDEARFLIAIADRLETVGQLINYYDCLIHNFDPVFDQFDHHIFHVELVRNLLRRQEWDLARERIQLIPPEFQADGWPHCLFGRALDAAGRRGEARREWEALFHANPNHPEALVALGK